MSTTWVTPTLKDGRPYRFTGVRPCAGPTCGRLVAWFETPNGKPSCHDEDGTSHFATCPDRDNFRRR